MITIDKFAQLQKVVLEYPDYFAIPFSCRKNVARFLRLVASGGPVTEEDYNVALGEARTLRDWGHLAGIVLPDDATSEPTLPVLDQEQTGDMAESPSCDAATATFQPRRVNVEDNAVTIPAAVVEKQTITIEALPPASPEVVEPTKSVAVVMNVREEACAALKSIKASRRTVRKTEPSSERSLFDYAMSL